MGASQAVLQAVAVSKIEVAVNGHVQAIVTHNTKDFVQIAPDFGVRVLTPAQLLLMMEKKP
jgi:hypothetical protein